ncbi:MAG: HAMP domain-containing sensor histidine kinase [Hydrogenothermaceae bacterium]
MHRQKDFIKMWLFEDIGINFVNSIIRVVEAHYNVELDNVDMFYGIALMKKIIYKKLINYKEINEEVRDKWFYYIISRSNLLIMVSSITYELNTLESSEDKAYQIDIFLKQHLNNLGKVIYAVENNLNLYELPVADNAMNCETQKILDDFLKLGILDKVGYDELSKIHDEWHNTYFLLKVNGDKEYIQNLKTISDKLIKFIREYFDFYRLVLNDDIVIVEKLFVEMNLHLIRTFPSENLEEGDIKTNLKIYLMKLAYIFKELFEDLEVIDMEEFDSSKIDPKKERYVDIYLSEKALVIKFKLSDSLVKIIDKDDKGKSFIESLITLTLQTLKHLVIYRHTLEKTKELLFKAESYARSKDLFLANMSHELRTPLNAIIGFSQILSKRKDIPENIKPYIEKINIAGKTLLELINNVLDFSKLESGKIKLNPILFNIDELLNEVKAIIEPLAKGKGLDFQIKNLCDDKNCYVDRTLLKQVLINLLSNGVKFTSTGGKVELEVKEYDESKVQFSVCDTGVGISEEDIKKLFQPFVQLENPMQKSVKGTGLGLVIVKKIVELHGGNIWVESKLGEGTCFRFVIPKNINKEIDTSIIEFNNNKEYTVVILEDSQFFGEILLDCLRDNFNIKWIKSLEKDFNSIISRQNSEKTFYILDFFIKDKVITDILKDGTLDKSKTIIVSSEEKIQIPEGYKFINKSQLNCEVVNKIIKDALNLPS